MRALLIFAFAAVPMVARNPVAQLKNTTHPGGTAYQVGDHFEVVVTGEANQPVSVRTTMQSRTDWSPVIGWTDSGGRWSTAGQFEKTDFGSWTEAWTVGGKLANPVITFSVAAPCLPSGRGQAFTFMSGPNIVMNCETAAGMQTFATLSSGDPLRTPDGRLISGETPEQMMGNLIEDSGGHSGQHGDEAAVMIAKVMGANALSDREIGNILSIIGIAFQNFDRNAPTARNPAATLMLLQRLANQVEQGSLKQRIFETTAFVLGQ